MPKPTHPEGNLLDFQREIAPLVYLAETIESDLEIPDRVRVLCLAIR